MTKNKITAVLGPTNTGKTHLAIETMLSFESGMIGFPLRLLAREVYDKVIKKTSLDKVALITGEEKIIPTNAKYFLCTVESMPIDKYLDFVGVDEIQMCADHERGHIFTDRLLNLRGNKLTMFMGSNTIKNIISKLDDDIEFIDRKRLSKLSYSGYKKISRINRKNSNYRIFCRRSLCNSRIDKKTKRWSSNCYGIFESQNTKCSSRIISIQ